MIAIAWIYVVLMMALAEALSSQGTVLGAVITFLLYGLLPLSLVIYILGTPARKRRLREAEAAEAAQTAAKRSDAPNGSSHAAGDTVTAERKEA